ncbi:MAG: DNA adenine methylase [Marmoricola sp.]
MIKYLGSKRLLVGVLGDIAQAVGAGTALDLFTGTTRVAQELKSRGLFVTAADVASYSGVFSDCYIATDRDTVDLSALRAALDELAALPGVRGYVTETFCEASRYFQPHNGMRIDAIRAHIEDQYADSPLRPILLTSLLDAADRVDSTTGLQMAYLKSWAPRSYEDLSLREPELLAGPGRTVVGDAAETSRSLPRVDLAYLDPPYNQHRYFTNYHVWETLIRWDAPEHYGIACKRVDARDEVTKSRFNRKREMPQALADLIGSVNAETVVVSYNDESWVTPEQMTAWLLAAGHEEVGVLAFDAKRYVGAQIGIFNGAGEKVGQVKKLRNTELVFVAGTKEKVAAATAAPSAVSQR